MRTSILDSNSEASLHNTLSYTNYKAHLSQIPTSFGVSVGDFLTAVTLIRQTVSALNEASGSSSQYRRLNLELHSLRKSLPEVDRLEPTNGLEATVEAVKATALSCQLPLQEFLETISKYEKCLALDLTAGVMKDVFV